MAVNRAVGIVDLSSYEVEVKAIPQRLRELYLGGKGIDMYLLYNLLKPEIDSLDPENVLLISAGLLTATPAPAPTRIHVAGKSPVSGLVESFYMGGFLGPELRFAGFDHLMIRGRASKPVYLWVHNGKVEIRDALALWRADPRECQAVIREELDDEDVQVMSIEVAGENARRLAKTHSGINKNDGLGGIGALMGSKKIKAIAIRGTMSIRIADPDEALRRYSELLHSMHSSLREVERLGQTITPWILFCQDTLSALADALGICKFQALFLFPDVFGWEEYGRILETVTGLKYTREQLMDVGERICNIERLLNIREETSQKEGKLLRDYVRCSILQQQQPGIVPGSINDRQGFEQMLSDYYEIHGWDVEGRPKPETLKRLGLDQEPSHML
nr:hypothetical protein [Desulfobacterales bacterium]